MNELHRGAEKAALQSLTEVSMAMGRVDVNYDSKRWQRALEPTWYEPVPGGVQAVEGLVLRTLGDESRHCVSLGVRAVSFLENSLVFWVSVSRPATCYLVVDGTVKDKQTCLPSASNVFQRHETNVTALVARAPNVAMDLVIAFDKEPGLAKLSMEGRHSPSVRGRPSIRHSLPSLLFQGAGWLTVLSCAVIIVANLPALKHTTRFYAVLVTVVAWLTVTLGIPSPKTLPIPPLIRRFLALPLGWRSLLRGGVMVGLCIVTSYFCVSITMALAQRQRYVSLVEKALQEPNDIGSMKKAFALLPWRAESKVLVERHLYTLKHRVPPGMWRKQVGEFISDDRVVAAMRRELNAASAAPHQAVDGTAALDDPVLWYAALCPEAREYFTEAMTREELAQFGFREESTKSPAKRFAVHLLDGRDDHRSRLFRILLKAEIADDDRDEVDLKERFDELSKVCAQASGESHHYHEFQMACDNLAHSAVKLQRYCEALYWFKQALLARERARIAANVIWLRPPSKYHLYFVFRERAGLPIPNEEVREEVREILEGLGCEAEGELFKPFSQYLDPDEWYSSTFLDRRWKDDYGSFVEYVEGSLLTTGWRYE